MVNMFLNSVVFVYDTCVLLVFFVVALLVHLVVVKPMGSGWMSRDST